MREFIGALPSVMRDIYGDRNLMVYYGCGCNLHSHLLYKPMVVPLEVFPFFIEDSIERRIFEICGSDLLIESPDSNIQILICHESDIHLDGAGDEAIDAIVSRFPELEFRTADEWKAKHDDESGVNPPVDGG